MRLRIIALALLASTALTRPAHADPIFTPIVAAISTGLNAIGVSVAGQAIIGAALLNTLPTLGTLALSYAANALLAQKPSAPPPQALMANFTTDQKNRYYASGDLRLGGIVTFAEARDGSLYKQIAHADAEATEEIQLYLNDIPVTLDGDHYVTTDEYIDTDNGNKYYRLYTRAGTVGQSATGRLMADFDEWTSAHVGAGVCDTLMTLDPVGTNHRAEILNHRGVLGLGEPDITRVARYGRYYDPRNDSTNGGSGFERADDPSTWGPSLGNLALLIVQHRMDVERFAMSPADINWPNIIEQANICDETVIDRYGQSVKRWRGAILIDKGSESNIDAENRMLAACDGIRFEDEDGKFGIFVGKYVEPDVILTDADIFDIESSETDDGENDYTHYYGVYTEPAFAYKESTTAVWVSPDWVEGEPIKTNNVDLHVLLDHNTSVRAVKAAGMRAAAKRALAITAGLRAKKLRKKRFVRLDLSDAALSGVYEVASLAPQEDGLAVQIMLNSTGSGNWDLLPGEEGERPNLNIAVTYDKTIENIAVEDMHISTEDVSAGNVRFTATFPVPSRPDYLVEIQYRPVGETIWEEYSVRTEDGAAATSIVAAGSYEHRWRITTIGGAASDWSDPVTADAEGQGTTPVTLDNLTAAVSGGSVNLSWTMPNSPNDVGARLYRGATNVFADATDVLGLVYASPNQTVSKTDNFDHSSQSAWNYWIVGENAAGDTAAPYGPVPVNF